MVYKLRDKTLPKLQKLADYVRNRNLKGKKGTEKFDPQ